MRRDRRAHVWDALAAADLLFQFGDGRSFGNYQADPMLRSAVVAPRRPADGGSVGGGW